MELRLLDCEIDAFIVYLLFVIGNPLRKLVDILRRNDAIEKFVATRF